MIDAQFVLAWAWWPSAGLIATSSCAERKDQAAPAASQAEDGCDCGGDGELLTMKSTTW